VDTALASAAWFFVRRGISSFSLGRRQERCCSSARQFHYWVWRCAHGPRDTSEKMRNSPRPVRMPSRAIHSISAAFCSGSASRSLRAACCSACLFAALFLGIYLPVMRVEASHMAELFGKEFEKYRQIGAAVFSSDYAVSPNESAVNRFDGSFIFVTGSIGRHSGS
jgi:hypothetical protein